MIKGVLLDLGGVVYVGSTPLPAALDAIRSLQRAGLGLRYITNTTRSPRRMLLERLRGSGLSLDPSELFMPAIAARRMLEAGRLRPHLLVHPALAEDFAGLADGDGEALVVGDAGDGFTYQAMNAAFRVLDRGVPFLALARNRSFQDADGARSLDAGAFVAALEYASERPATLLGKPAPAFFQGAVESLGCAPGEAVMVGDDAEADVAGALAAGLQALLLRSGKYRSGDETGLEPPPLAVLDDLAAAAAWILARRRR